MSDTTNFIKINGIDCYDKLSERLNNLTAADIFEALSINKADIQRIEINVDSDIIISAAQNHKDGAFYNCSNLQSVTIISRSNDTNIGAYAFYNCDKLLNISLDGVDITIGTSAFYNCDMLNNVTLNADNNNNNNNITIGTSAFYNCDKLQNISLDGEDITIGTSAFYSCNALKEVILKANNNITIGTSADTDDNGTFSKCEQIEKINIVSQNDIIIGKTAFYNCNSLNELYITANTISINESAFNDSYSTDTKYTNDRYVNIQGNEITINTKAFYNCDYLNKIELKGIGNDNTFANKITIGTSAFYSCNALKEVILKANNNITIGTLADTADNGAFSRCEQIKKIEIVSQNDIIIGRTAFYNCNSLNELDITAPVINIHEYAFDDSHTVDTGKTDRYVKIHGNKIHIYNRVFRECIYLNEIELKGIGDNTASEQILLDEYAFYNNNRLNTIDIIAENITVGDYAFDDSHTVDTGKTDRYVKMYGNKIYINNRAFRECIYLNEIELKGIGDDISEQISLDEYAFYNNNRLNTIDIIAENITVGGYAFDNSHSVDTGKDDRYVKMYGNEIYIYDRAFRECIYLNKIELAGITTSLTDADKVLADKIEIANEYAFYNCNRLSELDITARRVSISTGSFHSCFSNSVLAGKTTHLNIISEDVDIYQYAFKDCTYLNNINLIDNAAINLTTINDDLDNITYSNNTNITILAADDAGNGAFYNCARLKVLNIIAETVNIGGGAFYSSCQAKPAVEDNISLNVIGNNINIGQYTFSNCTYLYNININSTNYITIDNGSKYVLGAFYNCQYLKNINIVATNAIAIGKYTFCFTCESSSNPATLVINGKSIIIEYYAFRSSVKLNNIRLIATNGDIFIASSSSYADGAFYNCAWLSELYISATGSITVGDCAFNRCFNNKNIEGNINTVNILGNSISVGSHAFNSCTYLDTVSLIAFTGDISIAKNAKAANGTFASCTRLIDFTIDSKENVEIGEYAFWNCTILKNIYFNCKPPVANANSVSTITDTATGIYSWRYSIEWKSVIDIINGVELWYGLPMDRSEFSGNTGLLTIYERDIDNDTKIFGVHIDKSKYDEAVSSTTDNIIAIDIPTIYIDIDNNTHIITEISSTGFAGCNQISSITIPPNITDIGVSAFADCSGLVSIDIPDSIVNIPAGAFSNCTSLNRISIPTSVLNIAVGAFANVSPTELTAVWFPGNNTAGNMLPNDLTSITIPDKTLELPEDAFNGCTNVDYVNIPISVTTIHSNSFAGVKPETLKAAWFPGNKSAGNMLVDNLKNIIIPDKLISIKPDAFNDCVYVNYVNIPISVTNIQTNAFKNVAPTEIVAAWFPVEAGMLATNLRKITVQDSVVALKERAFEDCITATEIHLPLTLTTLNDYAFANCRNITSLSMSTVTYFGKYVFSGCIKINNITLPSNITIINDGLFKQCESLNTISIHNNITSIGKEAFLNSGITEVVIPKTINYIGENAFANCVKLTYASIPNNINIAENAFDGSNNITQLTASYIPYGMGSENLTNVIIPGDTSIIKANAFSTRNNTKTLKFDFTNCNNIPKLASEKAFDNDANDNYIIIVPNKLFANWVFTENWEKLYNNTSSEAEQTYISNNCEKTVIYYNNNTTVIQDYYNQEISSSEESTQPLSDEPIAIDIENAENAILIFLEKGITTIPNISTLNENTNIAFVGSFDITNIPEQAFYSCKSLVIVKSYNNTNITNIGDKAFYNCDKLLYVDGINTVLTIGEEAFYNCTSLKNLSNFSKLHEIGKFAFYNCSSLLEFNINYIDNDEQVADTDSQEPSVEQLKLDVINEYTFANCTSLTKVTIPKSVVEILDRAFYNCKNLEDISDISRVNIVGIGAFSHCESLIANTINVLINNIKIINEFSFENCNELVELDIPADITKIGNYAFSDCVNLITVKLNYEYNESDEAASKNYIGINAFAGCTKLAKIDLSAGFSTENAIEFILPVKNTSGYSGLVKTKDGSYVSNPKSFSSYPVLYAPFAQSIRDVVYDILSGYTLALDSFNNKFLPLTGCDKSNTKTQMTGDIIFNNDDISQVGIGITNDINNKNNITLTYYNNTEKDTVNLSLNSTNDNSFDITVNSTTNNIVDTYDVLDEEIFGSDVTIKTSTVGSTQNVSKTLSISTNNTLSWSGNTLRLNGINLTNDNGSLKWNNRHIHISERHIGEVFYTYRHDALINGNINGAYVCDGQTIEIPTTSKIIELLNANLIPHVSFSSTITFDNIGYFGYTENTGSPTQKIRIPNLMNDKLIIQAIPNSNMANTIGNTVSAGLPNVTAFGFMGEGYTNWNNYGEGALKYIIKNTTGHVGSYGGQDYDNYAGDFDASRCSLIYGNSNTVQPNTVRLLPLVQILDALELPILE